MMMVRTRFIDEALERAVAEGATHIVMFGAGFDSHAYRSQDLPANVQVFEVDRPATQAFKKQRVQDARGTPPRISPTYRSTFSMRTSPTPCAGTDTISRSGPFSSWKA